MTPTQQRYSGEVKWFSAEKGIGFIQCDNGHPDLFVHYSNIVGTGYRRLRDKQKVSFEITKSHLCGKLQASNVEVISD